MPKVPGQGLEMAQAQAQVLERVRELLALVQALIWRVLQRPCLILPALEPLSGLMFQQPAPLLQPQVVPAPE